MKLSTTLSEDVSGATTSNNTALCFYLEFRTSVHIAYFKSKDFVIFSGGIKREHLLEIG